MSSPATPPFKPPPEPANPDKRKKQLIIWAGVAAGVLAIAGGGAYWMFAEGAKPNTASVMPAPLPQSASPASAPAALPAASVVAPTPDASTTTAIAPAVAASAAVAEPSKPAASAPDVTKGIKPQEAESAPTPPPAIAKSRPDDAKPGTTQTEREAREAARKKQTALDQAAKQKERDKSDMSKANRTLDDLLK